MKKILAWCAVAKTNRTPIGVLRSCFEKGVVTEDAGGGDDDDDDDGDGGSDAVGVTVAPPPEVAVLSALPVELHVSWCSVGTKQMSTIALGRRGCLGKVGSKAACDPTVYWQRRVSRMQWKWGWCGCFIVDLSVRR